MDAKLESAILKNTPWMRLPVDVRQHFGGNEREYNRFVGNFAVQRQMKWDGLVKNILKDKEGYYGRVIEYSREHLMLFPYHLSRFIIRDMRMTPFQYYTQMVQDLFGSEQSYDQLPNFTAADVLRILGIGRNQYIEKMNQSRSKKLFRRRSVADVMPTVPVDDATIEPWWIVQPGCILQDDVKSLSALEKTMVDRLFEEGPSKAGKLDWEILRKLYIRGLVYLNVPISDDDCVSVPPLEGFVMNRVLGDYLETLLYKVFISLDEYTPASELANILQIELEEVRNAVSIFCRLGFVRLKAIDMDPAELHSSWQDGIVEPPKDTDETSSLTDLDAERSVSPGSSPLLTNVEDEPITPGLGPVAKRIGFMFDSTLTAFLMMGNLSPGLKNHAVTMFEVGKLADESIDSFLLELEKVMIEEEIQGEAKRYFDHAINLRKLLRFLRHNPVFRIADPVYGDMSGGLGLDLLRCESLRGLDKAALNRVLKKNYSLLVSLAPMSNEARPVCPLIPPHIGCPVPEAHSIWFKLYIYSLASSHPFTIVYRRGEVLRTLPRQFFKYDYLLLTPWGHDSSVIPSSIALALTNDALKHHAVMLQTYGNIQDPELVYVPFPGKNDENLSPNAFERHSAVQILRKELNLDVTCGYITLLNMASQRKSTGSDADSVGDMENGPPGEQVEMVNEKDWVLLDCCYGIPVFSALLCDEICRRIVDSKLFSHENLDQLESQNRLTSEKILDFIINHQDISLQISSASGPLVLEENGKEYIPLPTHNLGASGILGPHKPPV